MPPLAPTSRLRRISSTGSTLSLSNRTKKKLLTVSITEQLFFFRKLKRDLKQLDYFLETMEKLFF